MACEIEQKAFEDRFEEIQAQVQREIKALQADAEGDFAKLAEQADGEDLSQGIGAAAGAAVGTLVSGPAGAPIGAVIGREIGNLFLVELTMHEERFVFSAPSIRVTQKKVRFDVPTIKVDDQTVSFKIPVPGTRRVKGPPKPEWRTEWTVVCHKVPFNGKLCTKQPQSTLIWVDTWLDLPTIEYKEVRITAGLPQVSMQTREISFNIPEVAMKDVEVTLKVPSVKVSYKRDVSRQTAARTTALAQSLQESVARKDVEFSNRLKGEVAPLALSMFNCHRSEIEVHRTNATTQFEIEISKLSSVVSTLLTKGIPETDQIVVDAKALLAKAVEKRDEAAKPFNEAIEALNKAIEKAMSDLLNGASGGASFLTVNDVDESRELYGACMEYSQV